MALSVQNKMKIIASGLLLILVFLSYTSRLNRIIDHDLLFGISEKSSVYLNDTVERALITYASLRAANSVISMIQESEINLPGFTIAIGQALDPINDIIERCSWVMLVCLTSLGIQKVLLIASPWMGIQLFLTISFLVLLAAIWSPQYIRGINLRKLGVKIAVIALVLRLCVPVMFLVNNVFYKLFLKNAHERANTEIALVNAELVDFEKAHQAAGKEEGGIKGFFSRVRGAFDVEQKITDLKARFHDLCQQLNSFVRGLITWIVGFLIQTILGPIVFILGLRRILRRTLVKIT